MHGRGNKQAKAHLRFRHTRLSRLIRDIERKIAGNLERRTLMLDRFWDSV